MIYLRFGSPCEIIDTYENKEGYVVARRKEDGREFVCHVGTELRADGGLNEIMEAIANIKPKNKEE